jgi:predicted pyridoxine 5'-phosphate oxidase superfamily flavin-nucleotide-binding protein
MPYSFLDIAATPGVRAAQREMGAAEIWSDMGERPPQTHLGANEFAFIGERDSFYMATVSETGWPYVQHRGGPAGFLKPLDATTLAFADYRGNRQYISVGNLRSGDRAALILMDYPRRARLKIYAHVSVVPLDAEPALADALAMPGYRGRPERIFRLTLAAYDWNCQQHIVPRYTEAELQPALKPLRDRLAALESEATLLRAELAATRGEA